MSCEAGKEGSLWSEAAVMSSHKDIYHTSTYFYFFMRDAQFASFGGFGNGNIKFIILECVVLEHLVSRDTVTLGLH